MPTAVNNRRHVSPPSSSSGWRHAGELFVSVVIVCIAMHTFFLAGLIVPVTVSGGSMAETILGPRCEVVCPNCGITFACGHERLPAGGRAICLNCGQRNIDLNAGWDWPGEHALIDRSSLAFRPPRRWEVLVFRCPEQADTFCIKRVVGLPGESVQIRAGDIYVDGVLARKNLAQCRAVAQLVHDASFTPQANEDSTVAPVWRPREADSLWMSPAPGTFEQQLELNPQPEDKVPLDWLEFHPAHDRPLTDDDAYNQSESRRLNRVSDVMLSCTLQLTGPGEWVIRSEINRDRFDLLIHPQQESIRLLLEGREVGRAPLPANRFSQPTSFEFFRFDQQIFIAIDGKQILVYEFDSSEENAGTDENPPPAWALAGSVLHTKVEHLRLWRDIYYTVPAPGHNAWGVRQPVALSEDEFFLLGDNSPISADSRTWEQPALERKHLIGRLLTTW